MPRPGLDTAEAFTNSDVAETESLICIPSRRIRSCSLPLLVRRRFAEHRRIPSVLRRPEVDIRPPVVVLQGGVVRIIKKDGRPFHEPIIECLLQIDLGPLELRIESGVFE